MNTALRRATWSFVLQFAAVLHFAAPAEGAQVIRLGHFPNLTQAQALYARAQGEAEKDAGLHIEWVAFNAGPTAVESLFTDAIDMSYLGPNPTINGYIRSKGKKFVIIAGAASGGAGLVLRGDSSIQSEADFDGKTIATPQLGNTQDVAARIWFAQKGYRLTEKGGRLALVPLSNPDQLTMFRKKQIDGAWTVEPWVARLELEGEGRLFLDEKELWPDGRYVTTHLVVNRQFLAIHREQVKKLLLAHVEVTEKINADLEAAGILLNAELKKETGKALAKEVVSRAMTRVKFTWDPISSSLHKSAEAAHQVGFLRKPPNLEGIYDLGPLNEVLKEKNLPLIPQ